MDTRTRTARRALVLGIACLLGLASDTNAQTLSGRVVDGDGTPLPGVNVVVPALERGTVTNTEGLYRLANLPADTLTIAFSFIGYGRARVMVDLRAGSDVLDVTLREVVEALGHVTVREDAARAALTRSARSVARIEAAELEARRGQTLGETIAGLPGVTTLATGPSIHKPVIRGLHSDRVIVVNKGVPQQGQQWGAEHAPEIDPFAGARIEVVRGAAGVEYGAGAIGGVVRIEDEALPTGPSLGGQFSLNAFSNSRQAATSLVVAGSPSSVPGLGIRVQGSLRRAGDARTADYVLGNTAFFERSGEVAVGYSRGPLLVEAHASHFGTDLGVYRGSHFNTFAALDTVLALGRPPVDYEFGYEIDAPKQAISHVILALRGQHDLGAGARVEVQYGFQRNNRQEFDADRLGGRDPLARPSFDLTLLTHTLEGKLFSRPRPLLGGDGFAVIGLAGMTQGNRSEIGYLIPNFRSIDGGIFSRGAWSRGPLTLEAGARLDIRHLRAFPRASGGMGEFIEATRSWTGASGVAGAIWTFAPAWSIAGNLSAAWRPPSVNELYSFGIHHGTAQFEIGDPNLGAERSIGVDATLRHQGSRASAEVSAFASRIGGYVYLDPAGEIVVTVRGVFPEFRHSATDALLAGIDGAVTFAVTDQLSIGLDGALVRGTDTRADLPLIAMPADRLGVTAGFSLPEVGPLHNPGLKLDATFVRRQDRFPTQVNEDGDVVPRDFVPPPDGYTLLGIGFTVDIEMDRFPVRVSLDIENVLDTAYRDYLSRYRFFAHDPGRNIVLRLQVPFGSL